MKKYGSYRGLSEMYNCMDESAILDDKQENRRRRRLVLFLNFILIYVITYINERVSKDSETQSGTTKMRIAICIYTYLLYVHCIGHFSPLTFHVLSLLCK